ncbi:hypothetical protein [Bacillus phage SWEP1]|nr:hypothetical protein [Bacillus phage SWEP1]
MLSVYELVYERNNRPGEYIVGITSLLEDFEMDRIITDLKRWHRIIRVERLEEHEYEEVKEEHRTYYKRVGE